jgi:hypothetical protein
MGEVGAVWCHERVITMCFQQCHNRWLELTAARQCERHSADGATLWSHFNGEMGAVVRRKHVITHEKVTRCVPAAKHNTLHAVGLALGPAAMPSGYLSPVGGDCQNPVSVRAGCCRYRHLSQDLPLDMQYMLWVTC